MDATEVAPTTRIPPLLIPAAGCAILISGTLAAMSAAERWSLARAGWRAQNDPDDGRDHLDVAVQAMGHGVAAVALLVCAAVLSAAAIALARRRTGIGGLTLAASVHVGLIAVALGRVWFADRQGLPLAGVWGVGATLLVIDAAVIFAAGTNSRCRDWCRASAVDAGQ